MSRSGDLYELQSIDTLLDQYRDRLKEISVILADYTEIRSAEVDYEKAEKSFRQATIDLKEAEKKVRDQRLKIKSTDSKLYGGKITNPKELQSLQDESDALKRYLTILEDRQLDCMISLDEFSETFTLAKEKLENISEKKENLQKDLMTEQGSIEEQVQNQLSRRRSVTAIIISEDLDLYEELRLKGHGLAVAKVTNRSCSACGATLTAALNQVARSPNHLTQCETCYRILFS